MNNNNNNNNNNNPPELGEQEEEEEEQMETVVSIFHALETDLDVTLKKLKVVHDDTDQRLDELLKILQDTRTQVAQIPSDDTSGKLKQVMKNAVSETKKKDFLKETTSDFRSVYNQSSKMTRKIDTLTRPEISLQQEANFDAFPELSKAILEHLYSSGQFEVAKAFQSESSTEVDPQLASRFQELFNLLKELRKEDFGKGMQWIQANREKLAQQHDFLEFKIHKFQYLKLLFIAKDDQAALKYARAYFPQFSAYHLNEIKQLMGALLFTPDLENSPYQGLFHSNLLTEICFDFSRSYCRISSLPQDSPFYQIIVCGTLSLPKHLRLQLLLKNKFRLEAIAPSLPKNMQYHPVFVCPISKEQSELSNPPVLLSCGHAISKNSAVKLGTKFKCPYCPEPQVLAEVLELRL